MVGNAAVWADGAPAGGKGADVERARSESCVLKMVRLGPPNSQPGACQGKRRYSIVPKAHFFVCENLNHHSNRDGEKIIDC